MSRKRKIYILTLSDDKNKKSFFKKKKIKIIKLINLIINMISINFLKNYIKLVKRRILVESGLIFLNQLLKFKLLITYIYLKQKNFLKNNGYNNSNNKFVKRLKLKNKIVVNLNNDELFKIRIK